MTETNKPTSEEIESDVNYFKKKLLNAVIDENWQAAKIALNRLEQMEDDIIIYKLVRNPEKNIWHSPIVYVISIENGKRTKWLHNNRWIGALPFCKEFNTKEEAEEAEEAISTLPEIPEGYGSPKIYPSSPMSEEAKNEILGCAGENLEDILNRELSGSEYRHEADYQTALFNDVDEQRKDGK
jgi:hypothetical protein